MKNQEYQQNLLEKQRKFENPTLIILERSNREASYGPESPYHCTFKSCCYAGK